MDKRKDRIEKENFKIRNRVKSPETIIPPSCPNFSRNSYESLSSGTVTRTPEPSYLRPETPLPASKRVSELLQGYLKLTITEKDAKIMKLMAERREAQIRREELASAAHRVWERDKLLEEKRLKEKRKMFTEYLERKREMERFHCSIKKTEKSENLNREAVNLENKIAEEHEKAEKRQNFLIEKKAESRKKLSDFRTQLQRIKMEEKAEIEKIEKDRWLQVSEAKQRKCQEKLSKLCSERKRRTVEEREKRKLKWEAAKSIRDQMNWQISEANVEMMKAKEKTEEMRAEKVKCSLERRKKMVSEKNLAKRLQHDYLMAKIFEEEAEKIDRARRKIEEKDFKMKSFKEKCDVRIANGKRYALSTANLRQKIRTSYDV